MHSLSDRVQQSAQDIKDASNEYESTIDKKLDNFMQDKVKEAFEAAFAAFAEKFDEATSSVEQRLAQVESKLKSVPDAQVRACDGKT